MKTFLKTALFGSMLVAATSASAASVNINVSDLVFNPDSTLDHMGTLSAAQAAEAAYLASLNGATVSENFETVGGGMGAHGGSNQNLRWVDASASFSTNVGTFTLKTSGQGSTSLTDSVNAANDLLTIEDASTGEFGREEISAAMNNNRWLDSNDAKLVEWDLGAPLSGSFNSFGFYLADSADIAGKLVLQFVDSVMTFDMEELLVNTKTSGNVRYVTVTTDANIVGGKLSFIETAKNDGWGIDNITVGTVPEPGTLLLMGLGLLGLGAARRRTN